MRPPQESTGQSGGVSISGIVGSIRDIVVGPTAKQITEELVAVLQARGILEAAGAAGRQRREIAPRHRLDGRAYAAAVMKAQRLRLDELLDFDQMIFELESACNIAQTRIATDESNTKLAFINALLSRRNNWKNAYMEYLKYKKLPAWNWGNKLTDDEFYHPNCYIELDGESNGWHADKTKCPVKELKLDGQGSEDQLRANRSNAIPLVNWFEADACHHLIICGNAGCGKTVSVTRHLCRLVDRYKEQDTGASDTPSQPVIPILIECKSTVVDNDTSAPYFDDLIRDSMGIPHDENVEEVLQLGHYFIVFDDFEALCQKTRRLCCDALARRAKGWAGTTVVVTCRYGVSDEMRYLRKEGFIQVDITPLCKEKLGTFIKLWVDFCLDKDEDKDQQKLFYAIQELYEDNQRRSFLENPFFLTTICRIWHSAQEVLHYISMSWLLDRCINQFCERAGFREDRLKNARIFLQALAYESLCPSDKSMRLVKADERVKKLSDTGLFKVGSRSRIFWIHEMFIYYLASLEVVSKYQQPDKLLRFLNVNGWLNVTYENFTAFLPGALGVAIGKSQAHTFLKLLIDRGRMKDSFWKLVFLPFPKYRMASSRYSLRRLALSALAEFRWAGEACDEEIRAMERCLAQDFYQFSLKQRVELLEKWGRLLAATVAECAYGSAVNQVGLGGRDSCQRSVVPGATSVCWVPIPKAGFAIARNPVLVMEYRAFAESKECKHNDFWSHAPKHLRETIRERSPDKWQAQERRPSQPVTSVNWYEAVAYCKWLTAQHERDLVRLPTKQEWATAASCAHPGKPYPWGSDSPKAGDAAQANWRGAELNKPSPVGAFRPLRVAESELYDIVGNVLQWSQADVCHSREVPPKTAIALLGSSWHQGDPIMLQTQRQDYYKSVDYCSDTVGFRCSRHPREQAAVYVDKAYDPGFVTSR